MPYSKIVWIKLYLELFDEDDRFLYQLTERQQLLYIKMLYLAGRQKNKISKNPILIIHKINYQGTTKELLGDIKKIKEVFKKFQETKYYYTFLEFNKLHNRILTGTSKGTPKDSQRGIPDKDKDKDKEEDKENFVPLSESFPYLRDNTFKGTWDAWLETRKKMKVPSTDTAKKLALNKLHKVDKETAIKMIEQSVERGWRGVFPLSQQREQGGAGWKTP